MRNAKFFQGGETALHKACRRCHFSSVAELLSFVKNRHNSAQKYVTMVNKRGESSLHYAAQIKKDNLHFPSEDQKIVQLLMQNGSDVFMQTNEVSVYALLL